MARFWISTEVVHLQHYLVVPWMVPRESAAVSAHVLCKPYNHVPVYSVTSFQDWHTHIHTHARAHTCCDKRAYIRFNLSVKGMRAVWNHSTSMFTSSLHWNSLCLVGGLSVSYYFFLRLLLPLIVQISSSLCEESVDRSSVVTWDWSEPWWIFPD